MRPGKLVKMPTTQNILKWSSEKLNKYFVEDTLVCIRFFRVVDHFCILRSQIHNCESWPIQLGMNSRVHGAVWIRSYNEQRMWISVLIIRTDIFPIINTELVTWPLYVRNTQGLNKSFTHDWNSQAYCTGILVGLHVNGSGASSPGCEWMFIKEDRVKVDHREYRITGVLDPSGLHDTYSNSVSFR